MPRFRIVVPMKVRMSELDLRAMAPQMIRLVGRGKFKLGETRGEWTAIRFSFLHRLADMEEASRWGLKAQNDMAFCYSCHDVRLRPVEIIDLKPLQPEASQTSQFKIIVEFHGQMHEFDLEDLILQLLAKVGGDKFGIGQTIDGWTRFHLSFTQSCANEAEAKVWGKTKQQEAIAAFPDETIETGRVMVEE